MRTRYKRLLASCLAVLLTFLLVAVAGVAVRRSIIASRQKEAENVLYHYSKNITLQLTGNLNEVSSLAQMALVMGADTDWFEGAAALLLEQEEVRYAALIEGDTVVTALPHAVYADFEGRDINGFSYIYTLAKVVKGLVVEGPVSLDGSGDGETVFLFLQPFLKNGAYLGEVAVALDSSYVLEQFGLENIVQQGYDYELWRVDPQDGHKQVVASSSPAVDFSYAAKTSFYLPTQWNLSVQPQGGWMTTAKTALFAAVCLLAAFFLLVFERVLYQLASQRRALNSIASTDVQTGMPNRLGFAAKLERWLAKDKGPVALFYFVFDGYESLAMLIGPDEETVFLQGVLPRLKTYIKSPFLAGRLGRGCFIVAVHEEMDEKQQEDFARGLSLELLFKVRLNGERRFLTAHYQCRTCLPGCEAPAEINALIHAYYARLSQESPARMLTQKCRCLIEGQSDVAFDEYTDPEMLELSKTFNQYRKQVEQLAYSDPMFNVGNRPKFLRDVNLLISYDKKRSFSLFCVDICAFSQYNDLFSAEVGDEILREALHRLSRVFGSYLYRINGDVFLGISLSSEGAKTLSERLQLLFATPITAGNATFTLRVRVAACRYPAHGSSPAALLDCVQSALNFSKSSGQMIVIYDGRLSHTLHTETSIVHRLKAGILQQTLEVWYQPLFHLETGRYLAVEALVRLPDGQGGYFSAGQVVSLAERNGLVEQLGDYVLTHAGRLMCAQGAVAGLQHMGVNLSVQQLLVAGSADHLLELMHAAGISPKQITLEITESILIQSISQASAALDTLRAAGVRIALDDFGAGYSSLNYLSNLPVDVIKIDHSLTREILTNPKQRALLHSIVEMARINALTVVAEGVENIEEQKMVADSGVQYIQGYYYAHPLPEEALLRFLKEQAP